MFNFNVKIKQNWKKPTNAKRKANNQIMKNDKQYNYYSFVCILLGTIFP